RSMNDPVQSPLQRDRRSYLTRAAALVVGGLIAVVAPVAGLFTFFDPLRRKTENRGLVRVASISSLPKNGEPRKVAVLDELVDAWNRTPDVPIGSVYVEKTGPKTVRVLNAVCPHLGCSVGLNAARTGFVCPCHKSSFSLDGRILDPNSPSPRAMDELHAEVRDNGEVWVKFQNFRKGTPEKIPV
ncbi:MAG: Rieske (2Fe-2S) protein, partial [Gemmatimonadota bacterium]|nr:Rieske (2Fe-2S) protein [Gemmatimonadota bacterium]